MQFIFNDAIVNMITDYSHSLGAFMADSSYDSYYSEVFKDVKERMKSFQKENDVTFLTDKLVILILESCNIREALRHYSNIEYVADLKVIDYDQGANVNRKYKNPVYKVCTTGNETFYVVMECPNSLHAIWEMKNYKPKNYFEYQKRCFIKTIQERLKDEPCIVVVYDDTNPQKEKLSDVLYSQIKYGHLHQPKGILSQITEWIKNRL